MNEETLTNYEQSHKEIQEKCKMIISLIKKYQVNAYEEDFYRISAKFCSFSIKDSKIHIYVECYIGSSEYDGDVAILPKELLFMNDDELNHYFKNFDTFKEKEKLDELLDFKQPKQQFKL